LLVAGRQVRLAPLYDVASALPYEGDERRLRLAMKIGDDDRVSLHHNAWPRAARNLGLKPDDMISRVRDLAAATPQAFADAANAPEVKALDDPLPARLVDLVAERAQRCMRLVASP
jgi:serine/threonine-protein kinase HipA